jgi:hypothetical protein
VDFIFGDGPFDCRLSIIVSTLIYLFLFAGLAAVIADLKSGKVTLRKRQNPRQNLAAVAPKEDFNNIYQLLEKNQKQNRSSRKILDNELSHAFKKFNINI